LVWPVRRTPSARELFEEAHRRTAASTADRNVTIEAPAHLFVEGDESLIVQALVNLIENAAKYSTPGGSIKLRATPADGRVDLAVEDEGPGIPREDLPHVFERFYRAAEQSRRVQGSGLGLTIVKGSWRCRVARCAWTARATARASSSRCRPARRSAPEPC
jgi:signal transduction histidine kinase